MRWSRACLGGVARTATTTTAWPLEEAAVRTDGGKRRTTCTKKSVKIAGSRPGPPAAVAAVQEKG